MHSSHPPIHPYTVKEHRAPATQHMNTEDRGFRSESGRSLGSRAASGNIRDSMESLTRPVAYAADLGRGVGNFILGELGLQRDGPSSDPSQIQTTETHRVPSKALSDEVAEADRENKDHEADLLEQSKLYHSDTSGSVEADSRLPQSPGLFTNASRDMALYGSNHYNPKNDVLLNLETMTSGEVRGLNLALWCGLLLALGVLIWQFTEKIEDPLSAVRSFSHVNVNVFVGGVCLVALTGALIAHACRIAANWKKDWRRRRVQTTILVSVELLAQWINIVFFLWPNLDLYKYPCMQIDANITSYAATVRWTMWNTIFLIALIQAHNSNLTHERVVERIGAQRVNIPKDVQVVVADLPFWVAHWWKIVLWLIMEGSVAGMASYVIIKERNWDRIRGSPNRAYRDCALGLSRFTCSLGAGSLGVTSIMLFMTIVYFVLYCGFLLRALRQLRANSKTEFRLSNTIVRIQLRLRFPAFTFFIVSLLILWFVKPFTCASVFFTWLGMLPGQMSATILVICASFVGTPKVTARKGRPPLLQVWLQEFAWSEKDKPHKLEIRNTAMAVEDREVISKQPMFCVETMMICLYWSFLVYDYQEVEDANLEMEEGCKLFNPPLEKYEMIWEKSLDTKSLLAWNSNTILLSFRGTASLSNVKADVQAWRTNHQPVRGPWYRRPMVHSGFEKAWRNNGFSGRVMARLKDLFTSGEVDGASCRILVTGHSLGGAESELAAFEISSLKSELGCHGPVTCITFGAPRTGNAAFVKDLNKMVPDTWHVINDQDLVSRGGKFFFMYKRGGHRVIVNRLGDLLVRPSPIEASLRLIPCSGSVQQHLLTSYLQSIISVLLVQFAPSKGPSGEMLAVLRLIRGNPCLQSLLLKERNIEISDLEEAFKNGGSKSLLARNKSNPITARKSKETLIAQAQSTRGICSCCSSVSVWIRDARKKSAESESSEASDLSDVDVRDGFELPRQNPDMVV